MPRHGRGRDSLFNRIVLAATTIVVSFFTFAFTAILLASLGQLTPPLQSALLEVFPALVAIIALLYVIAPEGFGRASRAR